MEQGDDTNYYKILGIDLEANEKAIRKAYRKKALECHPDKNPDNPKAAQLFHELSKALEILTDPAARESYDRKWKARKANEIRIKQLDTRRRKMKEDLEKRERAAVGKSYSKQNSNKTEARTNVESLLEQMERIRQESARLLEEHNLAQAEVFTRICAEKSQSQACNNSTQNRIKIKWKADKTDANNGGYNKDILTVFLKKYGDIVALVMGKKNGSALVEFQTAEAAEMAVSYEKGILENPLHLEILNLNKETPAKRSRTIDPSDHESLVMRKLRQAAERQRIIDMMLKEDEQNQQNL